MNRLPDRRTLTWRSWLQDMIADSYERVHIAGELGINPATLTRWAHNESHPRPLGRQAHVHGQRHRDADSDGGAVDGGDHGLCRIEDAEGDDPTAVARRWSPVEGAGCRVGEVERSRPGGQVGPGAERPASPGDDDGAHIVVGIGAIEGVEELVQHRHGEGIEVVGAVEGDGQEPVLDVVGDLLVSQSRPSFVPAVGTMGRLTLGPWR